MDKRLDAEILQPEYQVYGKRWMVLLSLCLLNFCGAMSWLTFSTVAYSTTEYYNTSLDVVNWLSLIFMITAIPIGSVATLVLERYGLRPAYLVCGWLTCIGSALRIASTDGSLSDTGRLAILFTGQALVAIGQPFATYCPAKTATAWFPEDQRVLANLLGTVANPVGVVVVGLVSPLFEGSSANIDMLSLLITMAVPSAVTAIFTQLVMTSNLPPTPPSASAQPVDTTFATFLHGLKALFRNPTYLLLFWCIGGSLALYSTFVTLLTQILCPYGYTTQMAGACAAALTAAGVVGGIAIGVVCDRTKQFSTILKICYSVVTFGTAIFTGIFHINIGYLMIILIAGFGLFAFGILPVGMELAAECTYPVGVATSSGLIVLSGQLQSLVLILVLQQLGTAMTPDQTCRLGSRCYTANYGVGSECIAVNATTPVPNIDYAVTYDLSISIYTSTSYMGLLYLVLLLFFRPKYKRTEAARIDMNKATLPSTNSGYGNAAYAKFDEPTTEL